MYFFIIFKVILPVKTPNDSSLDLNVIYYSKTLTLVLFTCDFKCSIFTEVLLK